MAGLLNTDFASFLNIDPVTLAIIIVWTLVWKGIALWKSARKNSPVWFIVLLVVNTLGILEILYIFLFSKLKLKSMSVSKKPARKRR